MSLKVRFSLLLPFCFVLLLWGIKGVEVFSGSSLRMLGVVPRDITSLPHILTAPLVHANFGHLLSNSAPLCLLGAALLYFYTSVAHKIVGWIYVIPTLLVWITARPGNHLGASGIIYGLAFFLFFSGVLRKYKPLIGLSLLVTFVYGGLTIGLFPGMPGVSWEGHLAGALTGTACAYAYRDKGPQRPKYQWEIEDEEADKSYGESLLDLGKGSR